MLLSDHQHGDRRLKTYFDLSFKHYDTQQRHAYLNHGMKSKKVMRVTTLQPVLLSAEKHSNANSQGLISVDLQPLYPRQLFVWRCPQ